MKSTYKTLIFDLSGVLFHINKKRVLRFIGMWDVICYYLKYRKNPVTKTFEFLDTIARHEEPPSTPILYKKYWQPACITSWVRGTTSSICAYKELHQKIELLEQNNYFSSPLELRLIKKILETMISPDILIKCWEPATTLLTEIATLRATANYKLILLSNLDKETYQLLRNYYAHYFDLFDDVIISAEIGLVKPDPQIFHTVLSKHNILPHETYFFDDQQENILAAQNIGISSFLCSNEKQITRQIYKLNRL
jgi:HAD superfamily hydrolase (TIGR01509 family)